MTTQTHIAIETIYTDGRKVYRFIEGAGKASTRYAGEQAQRFMNRPNVRDVRTFGVTADERAALKANS